MDNTPVLSWKNIFILFLSLSIFMLSLVLTRTAENISRLEKSVVSEYRATSPENIFRTRFSLQGVNLDREIHEQLENVLEETGADWVVFWGFHNGKTMGPLHLKRMSVIDETSVVGKPRFYPVFQNWNLNIFASYYLEFWDVKEPIYHFVEDIHNQNVQIHFGERGVFYKNSIPIYIDLYDHPVGLVALYYGEDKAAEIKKDYSSIKKQDEQLTQAASFIEEAFRGVYGNEN